jgi:hypothetical protein
MKIILKKKEEHNNFPTSSYNYGQSFKQLRRVEAGRE